MSDQDFTAAPIKGEAYVLGPEETGIYVFSIEGSEGKVLFELSYRFDGDRDFFIVISNFGICRDSQASSKTPDVQRPFAASEIASARRRLEDFFLGPEPKTFGHFATPQAKCLGVDFLPGWAHERR